MVSPVDSDVPLQAMRRRVVGLVVCSALAVLAATIAWGARWGPDWPAQEFRAWSAAQQGLTAWTNQWYSGQALPGYSIVYPLVSGVVGAPVTGLLAVLIAFAACAGLAPVGRRRDQICFDVSVAFVLATDLFIGQVPYLVGVAFGAWALRILRSGSSGWRTALCAGGCAVGCALSSPLAGSFLLIAVPAIAAAQGWRRTYPLTAAGAGIVASALFGGGSGPFPFRALTLVWVTLFVVLAFALTVRGDTPIRRVAIAYGLATLAALTVANPVGSNIARFGQLITLPLLWYLRPQLRWSSTRVLAVLSAAAALWTSWPAVSSLGQGEADPSRAAAYYTGLESFLDGQDATAGRLEVVFSREHWESLFVAQNFPIARGWERQTDLDVNSVLYHPLTAATYRGWLDANAVSLVALPNVPIDYGGEAEAALLRHPPSYLVPAWRDRNWQVWRVHDPRPLVTGPARMLSLGAASFRLDFRGAGSATVRIRGSWMWTVTAGTACVRQTPDGWLSVTTTAAGPVTLRSRAGLPASASEPRCS